MQERQASRVSGSTWAKMGFEAELPIIAVSRDAANQAIPQS
jgi:hypothetical protein